MNEMGYNPKVSVIIPTYGRPEFLPEAVSSVLEQTYSNLEVIVVDDCSPEAILLPDHIDDRRVYIFRHERNLGPGAARNTGLAHATGELVTFLDDDDRLMRDRIAQGVRQIGDANFHIVNSTENSDEISFIGDFRHRVAYSEPPSACQALVRREHIVQFDPTLRVSEDIDWWLRMSDRAIFAGSAEVGLWIRRHDSPRAGVTPRVRLRCRELVAHRHKYSLGRRGLAYQYARVSMAAVQADRPFVAIRYAVMSLWQRPSTIAAKLLVRALVPSRPRGCRTR